MDKVHTAAIYCRLSEEDRNKTGPESESIQNQKTMLEQYALEQGWRIWKVYSDEDYAGADRSRPAFNALLRDAKAGRFDIVLCKSQSRFTRELELVETYIHGKFMEWGIRFIGCADHADTDNRGNKKSRQINGLVNEWYLEDLSENIKSVFRSKQRNGKFIGSFAPYGYKKSDEDKNVLVPDDTAAAVVKKIFEYSADGVTVSRITAELNRSGILNPSAYKAAQYPSFHRAGMISTEWSAASVRAILTNPVYYGALRQHIREKISYKSDRIACVDKKDQILVEDIHCPLISKEEWLRAQPGKASSRHIAADPLQKKCRCAVCNQPLKVRYSHQKKYFTCAQHHVLIRRDIIEELEKRTVIDENASDLTLQGDMLRKQDLFEKLKHLYEDHAAGAVPDEVFRRLQKEWNREYRSISQRSLQQPSKSTGDYLVYPRKKGEAIPRIDTVAEEAAWF